MTLLVKYRENFVRDKGIHSWQWVKVLIDTKDKVVPATKYKRLSEEEADAIIKAENLEKVESDNVMEIWDTPDRSFQKEYKGKIKVTDLR